MKSIFKTKPTSRFSRVASLLTVLALAVSLALPSAAFAAEKTITIFHTNDSHGRLVNDSSTIGIDRIAQIKLETPNALLVDVGDTFHGLPFVTINTGYDAVELMNIAGYDVFTPGNHDFNYGYEHLLDLLETAEFEALSVNVKKDGEPIFNTTAIIEVDGVQVGFFGVTTPETLYKTNPLNVQGIVFDDVVECSREAIAELTEQGVDIIVALAHLGTDEGSEITSALLAEELPEIDLIIDGHSHSYFENGIEVNGVLIASANEYEKYLGQIEITFDDDNNIVDKTASLIDYTAATEGFEPNEAVLAEIDAIIIGQSEIMDVVVTELGYTLSAQREPGVRTQEMPLGNLAADALKAGTGADIALTNGGGLRENLNEGLITKGDIIAVLPFGNYAVTKYVSPKDLKELMENGVALAPASAGKFPQISGFEFAYDPSLPAGERVLEITVDGVALDLEDTETKLLMATNDFMAAGGDEYTTLGAINTENEFGALDELLIEYMATCDIEYTDVEGRITVIGEEAAEPTEEDGTTEAPADDSGLTAQVVNCSMANVRAGSGVQFSVITVVRSGEEVEVLDFTDKWVKISTNGKEGWVFDSFLDIKW